MHQPAGRAGAAQGRRCLDMEDGEGRLGAPVAGENDLPTDLELVSASLMIVAHGGGHVQIAPRHKWVCRRAAAMRPGGACSWRRGDICIQSLDGKDSCTKAE